MTQGEDTAPDWRPDGATLEEWGVTADEARDLLRRQMCPACGRGPWMSPLTHAAKKHGIDRHTMRDVCGVTTVESVVEPELSERIRERGKARDMSEVARSGPRKKYRTTAAGRAATSGNLRRWEEESGEAETSRQRLAAAAASKLPEAVARQAEALQRQWAALTPEQRRARSAPLTQSTSAPEVQRARAMARWEGRRQPCGTVAAYKRGCRCDDCREAKRESR